MTNQEFIESIRLEGEEWRDVPDWEEYYAVSTLGRIVSKGRLVTSCYGTSRWTRPILKKPYINHSGYCTASLCRRGKQTVALMHRLVASAFIPNPGDKPQIDHIDGNRSNNVVSNLRWCTGSENMHNPYAIDRCRKVNIGRKHPEKYNPIVCLKDGVVVKNYQSTIFAEDDGFKSRCVYQACTGKRKTYKGYLWMYLSEYETLVQYIKELFGHPPRN